MHLGLFLTQSYHMTSEDLEYSIDHKYGACSVFLATVPMIYCTEISVACSDSSKLFFCALRKKIRENMKICFT